MQELMNFLRTDNYLLILSILVVLLFIGFVVLLISNMNLKNKYKKFMHKNQNTFNKNKKERLKYIIFKSHSNYFGK